MGIGIQSAFLCIDSARSSSLVLHSLLPVCIRSELFSDIRWLLSILFFASECLFAFVFFIALVEFWFSNVINFVVFFCIYRIKIFVLTLYYFAMIYYYRAHNKACYHKQYLAIETSFLLHIVDNNFKFNGLFNKQQIRTGFFFSFD